MGAAQSEASCGLQVPVMDGARLIHQLRNGDMLLCLDQHDSKRLRPRVVGDGKVHARSETLLKELFRVHDLNKDGLLDEGELIQLNKKVALLHYGKDADLGEVEQKYKELFRSKLDAQGRAVPFATFRKYMVEVLQAIDTDASAQEMIMEQFIAEAGAARAAFHVPSLASEGDAPFLSKISFDEASVFGAAIDTLRWDTPTPRLPRNSKGPPPGPGVVPGPKLHAAPPNSCGAGDRVLQSRLPPTAGSPWRSGFDSGYGGDFSGSASTGLPPSMQTGWGSSMSAGSPYSAFESGHASYGRWAPRVDFDDSPLLPLPPPPPPAPPRQGRRKANAVPVY